MESQTQSVSGHLGVPGWGGGGGADIDEPKWPPGQQGGLFACVGPRDFQALPHW